MKNRQAFTLVELIVVIVILAILGTIAFISLQGYGKIARDSARISDIANMRLLLEIYHMDYGKYPTVTDGYSITHSGTVVWNQGIFGEDTYKKLDKLEKVPLDPLTKVPYTYSLSENRQEYQLGGIRENIELTLNNFDEVSAAEDKRLIGLVRGNYNNVGLMKTNTGDLCEIVVSPSMISSLSSEVKDLEEIISSGGLVYDGYNNLPGLYQGGDYNVLGGFDFSPKRHVVYSGENNCEALSSRTYNSARVELITNLQEAYSGTILEEEETISKIINIDINDINEVNRLTSNIVSNSLDVDIVVSNSSTSSNTGPTPLTEITDLASIPDENKANFTG